MPVPFKSGQFRAVAFHPVMGIPRRRRMNLGALTPAQAAAVGMPTITKTAGFTQAVFNMIQQDVSNGYISSYVTDQQTACAKAGNPASISGALTSAGSGIALKLVAAGTVAGPAAPLVIAAGVVLGIFSAVFNHHALAVAKEQGTLCAAVPAANTAVSTVVQAVQAGTITPSVGAATLQQVLQDFTSTVSPIMKNDASNCNAACVMVKDLTAIVAYFTSQFQDLASKQAAAVAAAPSVDSVTGAVTSDVSTAATSLGIPSWALYAAAGAALLFLLK